MVKPVLRKMYVMLSQEFPSIDSKTLKYAVYAALYDSKDRTMHSFDEECTDILMHEHPDGKYSAADRREVLEEIQVSVCRSLCADAKWISDLKAAVSRAESRVKGAAKAKQSNGLFSAPKSKQTAKACKAGSKKPAAKQGGKSRGRGLGK